MNAPCKDCKLRDGGCHDRCDLYKEYKKELKRIDKSRKEFSEFLGYKVINSNKGKRHSIDNYQRWSFRTRRG